MLGTAFLGVSAAPLAAGAAGVSAITAASFCDRACADGAVRAETGGAKAGLETGVAAAGGATEVAGRAGAAAVADDIGDVLGAAGAFTDEWREKSMKPPPAARTRTATQAAINKPFFLLSDSCEFCAAEPRCAPKASPARLWANRGAPAGAMAPRSPSPSVSDARDASSSSCVLG